MSVTWFVWQPHKGPNWQKRGRMNCLACVVLAPAGSIPQSCSLSPPRPPREARAANPSVRLLVTPKVWCFSWGLSPDSNSVPIGESPTAQPHSSCSSHALQHIFWYVWANWAHNIHQEFASPVSTSKGSIKYLCRLNKKQGIFSCLQSQCWLGEWQGWHCVMPCSHCTSPIKSGKRPLANPADVVPQILGPHSFLWLGEDFWHPGKLQLV